MDLGEILRLIAKRWYVAFPSLLLGAALPAAAYTSIPTKFQSQSTICLLNSSAASDVAPHLGNPFLSFDASLTPTADVLARKLSTSQSGQELLALGVTETTSAKLADNATGPFVTLTLEGTDKAHTLQSMQIFDNYAADQLRQLQLSGTGGVPTDALIRSVVIVPPQDPVPQMKSKYEAVAGAGAAGMVLAFFAVFGFENVANRRAAKQAGPSAGRSRRPADDPDEFPDDEVLPAQETQRRRPVPSGTGSTGANGSSPGLRVRGRSDAGGYDADRDARTERSERTERSDRSGRTTERRPGSSGGFDDAYADLDKSFEGRAASTREARSAAETAELSLEAIKRGGGEDLGWFPRLDEMDMEQLDGLGDLAVADRESDKS